MSVAVIGKSGFIARALAAHPACQNWTYLDHRQALADTGWANNARCVINCALAPDFYSKGYDAAQDIDSNLAGIIADKKAHYIMLSTRLVYGSKAGLPFRETDEAAPDTFYALAKFRIEENLTSVLGQSRLTILRIANIFGHEYGRKNFFGMALTKLRDEKKIMFDIAPDSLRDFLAAWRFAEAIEKIAQKSKPGLFNLGSGFGTKAADIAAWLIEGYGAGEVVYTDRKTHGQFWLDMDKTQKAFGLSSITSADLKKDCLTCGQHLKNLKP